MSAIDELGGAPESLFLFDKAHSSEVVSNRISAQADPRFRQIMEAVVRHLHDAVKELELTPSEWEAAIGFLTRTGQMCTDWRQEFILLSDVLGVSMLVDAINHRRPGATESTVLGPFYVPKAPRYSHGTNICLDGGGEPLVVRGRVLDIDGRPIAGALIDVWQASDEGFYDVQQKGIQPDWNLRGVFTSNIDGEYWFRSIKPKSYPVPNDGSVGKMLDKLGRHAYRPAHIHFIVSATGYEPVVTHIFASDCPYLKEDVVFGVKAELIADFKRIEDAEAAAELNFSPPFWSVAWDFVLARDGGE